MARPDVPGSDPGRRRVGWLIRVGITLLLIAVVILQVDLGETSRLLLRTRWDLLSIAVLLAAIERVVSTLRWQVLLAVKGIEVRFRALFQILLSATVVGTFLPTSFSFDAIRAVMLSRRTGGLKLIAAAGIVDRLTWILPIFALALLGLGVLFPQWRLPVLGIAALSVAAGVLAFGFLAHSERAWHRISTDSWWSKTRLGSAVRDIGFAVLAYRSNAGPLIASGFLALCIFVLRVGMILSMAMALSTETRFTDLLFALPPAWLLTMLPISIGGLGLQEGAYIFFLGTIGIGVNAALSISVLDHILRRAVCLPALIPWLLPSRSGDQPST